MNKDRTFPKLLEKAIVTPNELTLIECCILERDLEVSADTLINSCEAISIDEYGKPTQDPIEWLIEPKISALLKKAILWPGQLTLSECMWLDDVLGVRMENFKNNIHPEEIELMDEELYGSIDEGGDVFVDIDL